MQATRREKKSCENKESQKHILNAERGREESHTRCGGDSERRAGEGRAKKQVHADTDTHRRAQTRTDTHRHAHTHTRTDTRPDGQGHAGIAPPDLTVKGIPQNQ